MDAGRIPGDFFAPKRRKHSAKIVSSSLAHRVVLAIFRTSLLLHSVGVLIVATSTLMPSAAVVVGAQSTCDFLKRVPYLQNVTPTIPAEPLIAAISDDSKANDTNLPAICGSGRPTCCVSMVEAELARHAQQELEHAVQAQVQLLADFFDTHAAMLRKHALAAVTLTERQLAAMFRLTYGPYYADHAQVFEAFFDRLRRFLTQRSEATRQKAEDVVSEVDANDAHVIFDAFFDDVYVAEFALLNPTVYVSDTARKCMTSMRSDLRPFGTLPEKIVLLLSRGFNTWRVVLDSLNHAAMTVKRVKQKITLTPSCIRAATQMRYCHLCTGETPGLRPCLGYCTNVLRGCFAALVDISPQFQSFTDSLLRLTARLKGVHNPYGFLAPLPAQISEAIMNFQENGIVLSRRVQFRCFQPEFRFRVRRKAPESDSTSKRERLRKICDELPSGAAANDPDRDRNSNGAEDIEIDPELEHDSTDIRGNGTEADSALGTRAEWFELYAQSGEKTDAFRENLLDFVDKLQRTSHFWTSIASSLCEDGGIAAARPRSRRARDGSLFAEAERCWNGSASAAYRRPVIASDVSLRKNALFNPEFRDADRRLDPITSGIALVDEGHEFASLSTRLDACYEDHNFTDSKLAPISTNNNSTISVDDEDGDELEASGSAESEDDIFEEWPPAEDGSQHVLAGGADLSGGGKRYATFRHPVSNTPVVVTRNLPSSSSPALIQCSIVRISITICLVLILQKIFA